MIDSSRSTIEVQFFGGPLDGYALNASASEVERTLHVRMSTAHGGHQEHRYDRGYIYGTAGDAASDIDGADYFHTTVDPSQWSDLVEARSDCHTRLDLRLADLDHLPENCRPWAGLAAGDVAER